MKDWKGDGFHAEYPAGFRFAENFTEITKEIQANNEPVFLTKNGVGSIFVMSMEAYENHRYDSLVFKETELQARETAHRRSH